MTGQNDAIVDVLVPVAVDTLYSYKVQAGLSLAPGDIVRVPLGTRETRGVVWGTGSSPPTGRLKRVVERVDLPPLTAPMRRFVDRLAAYTLTPRGMVLRMVLRVDEHAGAERPRIAYRLVGAPPQRVTPARRRVLERLADGMAWPKGDLVRAASVSPGVIDGLVDAGTLESVALPPEPLAAALDPDSAPPRLGADQDEAARRLVQAVGAGAFAPHLLEGVTGSGKTAVYFEAVAETLRRGRQALILLPEIALTHEFRERFAERFGGPPAEWHSTVSSRRRARLWLGVAHGEVPAVVGARSALFLPFHDLGLIVVDEEHDQAYKQEDGALYNARDMAVLRAQVESVPIVLSSATPALETRVNAETGRYGHLVLPSRIAGAMPDIEALDMRREGPARGRWLAPRLVEAVRETVAARRQALLFLNRRGYAPLTLCRACGHRFQCPNCTAWLVEHRFRGRLACHHCGYSLAAPTDCPECAAQGTLSAVGPGIERIAEEVADIFPDARRVILSSDLMGGVERLRAELARVAEGEADIVIGTQIVAKGHNFPGLTLVGVVDADLGLANGDPRAAEKSFQLLTQVVGRAGRAQAGSRGLVQSYAPDHPVIAALVSGDAERFYEVEAAERRAGGLPPFGRLAGLVVSGEPRSDPASYARALARAAPQAADISVLGPAEAPIALLRGRQRFRLLVKAPREADLQGFLRTWLAAAPPPRGTVRLAVDIDPQSFL